MSILIKTLKAPYYLIYVFTELPLKEQNISFETDDRNGLTIKCIFNDVIQLMVPDYWYYTDNSIETSSLVPFQRPSSHG